MKSLHPRLLPAALLVVSPLLLASCARMQSWLPSFDAAAPPNAEIAVPPPELALSQSERRSQLREAARAYVDETESDEGELVKKSPYWLKEYVQYPNGTAGMRLSVRETESRTAPLIGDVQLDKQRLATRLYRDKDNAAQDTSYLRQTGTEVVTFARRHGEWVRIGSMFVAERTEERIDGAWRRVAYETPGDITDLPEEEPGWFGRAWSQIFGD